MDKDVGEEVNRHKTKFISTIKDGVKARIVTDRERMQPRCG